MEKHFRVATEGFLKLVSYCYACSKLSKSQYFQSTTSLTGDEEEINIPLSLRRPPVPLFAHDDMAQGSLRLARPASKGGRPSKKGTQMKKGSTFCNGC